MRASKTQITFFIISIVLGVGSFARAGAPTTSEIRELYISEARQFCGPDIAGKANADLCERAAGAFLSRYSPAITLAYETSFVLNVCSVIEDSGIYAWDALQDECFFEAAQRSAYPEANRATQLCYGNDIGLYGGHASCGSTNAMSAMKQRYLKLWKLSNGQKI
jgi:hypothetical protein